MFYFGYFLGLLISCTVFGVITLKINEEKGRDGGFWWGFLLGVVGIIVVACRASIQTEYSSSYQTGSYLSNNNTGEHQSPKASLAPAKAKKPVGWICASCGKENEQLSKFCSGCGERRHYKWICGSCGKENAPETKFCPECGNMQTEDQECIPQQYEKDDEKDEAFLKSLLELDGAGEMLKCIREEYPSTENSNMQHLMEDLRKMEETEKIYGKETVRARNTIQHFLDAGGKYYTVDRSGEKLICPNCGREQNVNRKVCLHCAVLFCD